MPSRSQYPYILLFILAVIAGCIWYAVFHYEARFHVLTMRVFDVGQGDGIFFELPDGNQIVVDGGPDKAILSKLGRIMPPWDRDIDLLVLTHPHADHLDGLFEIAKRYHIGMVLESGSLHSIPEYAEWHALLAKNSVPVVVAIRGQRIAGPEGFSLDVLSPAQDMEGKNFKNIHDAMVVTRLEYGSTTAMLMGDAEQKIEYQLMQTYGDLRADILKVGHHGSKTSTSGDFLKAISPVYAAISVGRKNRYGHPYQEVIDRLETVGAKIFRTDRDGDITFVSDGEIFGSRKNR